MTVSSMTMGGASSAIPTYVQEKVSESWDAPTIDQWLEERLSAKHKAFYAGIMKARYTTTEKFSVEFDSLIDTLGYAKKEKAALRLERDFVQDRDYISLPLEGKRVGQHGGSNVKLYGLTINCAERFSVTAETEKGKEVRDFFVRVFDVIQDYHLLTLLIEKKLAVFKARHDALLSQYPDGKHVFYRFWVGRQGGRYELQKPGKTNQLESRTRQIISIYEKAFLADVVETHYNQELEATMKADPLVSRFRVSRVIKGEKQTELFEIRDELTDERFGKISRKHLKSLGSDDERKRLHTERMLQNQKELVAENTALVSALVAGGLTGSDLKDTLAMIFSQNRAAEEKFDVSDDEPANTTKRVPPGLSPPDGRSAVASFVENFLINDYRYNLLWTELSSAFKDAHPSVLLKGEKLKAEFIGHGLKFSDTTFVCEKPEDVPLKHFRGFKGYRLLGRGSVAAEPEGGSEQNSQSP